MSTKEFNCESIQRRQYCRFKSGYQGYHRSHHRSHTQESQSEKIEVTIQGHTEESDSSQIEKKTKISLPWKHKGHILIFSLILSIF